MLRLERIKLKHARLYSITRTEPFDGFKLNADDVIRFVKLQTPLGSQFQIQLKCDDNSDKIYMFTIPEPVMCELDLPVDQEITREVRH